MTDARCMISGCEGLATRCGGVCEKHYYRKRRTGQYALKERGVARRIEGNGYVSVKAPSHPLARNSYVREHRKVFFDAHGGGTFRCHWCGATLLWPKLDVDHLDANKQNNALSNLVPACPGCNRKRAYPKARASIRERSLKYSLGERTLTLAEWSGELGISRFAILWRINHGWPLNRALSEPRGKFGPRP